MARQVEAQVLTATQAADYLGVSPCTLKKIDDLGLLKPYRTPGGHRRYRRRMIDQYLEASTGFSAEMATKSASLHEEVRDFYHDVVMCLVAVVEARDPYAHGHSHRVAANTVVLAEYLGINGEHLDSLEAGAYLHDLAKIAVILSKRSSLSSDQRRPLKEHPVVGARILEPVGFDEEVVSIVLSHHERIDGKGYPSGLKGDAIPVGARIVCVLDSFDAMASDRPHQPAMPGEVVLRELHANAGTQFDPQMVEKFVEAYSEGEIMLPSRAASQEPQPSEAATNLAAAW